MYLSVVIPAYNEQKRIRKTLESVVSYLSRKDFLSEIIVVNDGSKDATAEVVSEFSVTFPHVRLIDNGKNHGKGYVVRQGMLAATGEIRLFMDADNSTTVDHVERMFPYFSSGFDVVIGSRRVAGSDIAVHQPMYKELLGRVANLVIQIFGVWGITDTQAGFKAFTARAAHDIFSRARDNSWLFDVEVLAIARMRKYKIREVPIRWVDDSDSRVTMGAYIKSNFEVLRIRWNLITGKYN